MTIIKAPIKAPSISKIIAGQFAATVGLLLAGFGLSGVNAALSLGLGGLICWAANGVFVIKAFKYQGASATEQIVKEFAAGEAYKIVLSGVGFALTFIYVPAASPLLVFVGFIGVYLVGLGLTMSVVSAYNQSANV
ncbi:MAG: F0F1 ATP synthase subunit I [Pseudohongiellaceae bacterium]